MSDKQTFCWALVKHTNADQAHHACWGLRSHATLVVALEHPSCTEPGPLLSQAATSYNPIHQPTNQPTNQLAVNYKCSTQVHCQMDHNSPSKWAEPQVNITRPWAKCPLILYYLIPATGHCRQNMVLRAGSLCLPDSIDLERR